MRCVLLVALPVLNVPGNFRYPCSCSLKPRGVLEGHSGCINTACWAADGRVLFTGSDDTQIGMWDGQGCFMHLLRTVHTANILSVASLSLAPRDGSLLATASYDGLVRVTAIGREDSASFTPHNEASSTYCVSAAPGQEGTFLSCGELGRVVAFDLRCSRPPLETKLQVIADCRTCLYTVAQCPVDPNLTLVCGAGPWVSVLDLRRLEAGAVTHLCPAHLRAAGDFDITVTSAQWSNDGLSIVANYGSEHVYEFDVHDVQQAARPPPTAAAASASKPATQAKRRRGSRRHSPSSVSSSTGRGGVSSTPWAWGSVPVQWPSNWTSTEPSLQSPGPPGYFDAEQVTVDLSPRCSLVVNFPSQSQTSAERPALEHFDAVAGEVGSGFRAAYSGRCNMMTVKGVSYWGDRQQYIVSGCDSGSIFFWSRKHLNLAMVARADEAGPCNVVEPHPHGLPMLVTAGIDTVARFWEPAPGPTVAISRSDVMLDLATNFGGDIVELFSVLDSDEDESESAESDTEPAIPAPEGH